MKLMLGERSKQTIKIKFSFKIEIIIIKKQSCNVNICIFLLKKYINIFESFTKNQIYFQTKLF